MLNISVRNWSLRFSLNGKSLKMEKSKRWKPGPGTCVTPPKFAKVQLPTTVQGVGSVKAAGLPNQETYCFPLMVTSWIPSFRGCPVNRAPQARPELFVPESDGFA